MKTERRSKRKNSYSFALSLLILLLVSACGGQPDTSSSLPVLGAKIPQGGDTLYHQIGDFTFTDQNGEQVSEKFFHDKIWVADVFFTTCPGICPRLSASIARVQEAFAKDPEVAFLSITVDPETDTLEALQAYASKYGADPGQWKLVTGNKRDLYEFANKRFFFKAMEGEGGELGFIHDQDMRLIDKQGRMRGEWHYDGTQDEKVDKLIIDIKTLKNEYKKQ